MIPTKILEIIKSCTNIDDLNRVKQIVWEAYCGNKTVLGDYVHVSHAKMVEIIKAISVQTNKLDDGANTLLDAIKDYLL